MLRKYDSYTDYVQWTQTFNFHYPGLLCHWKEYLSELIAIQETNHNNMMRERVLTLQGQFHLNKAASCFTAGLQILCNTG